MNAEI